VYIPGACEGSRIASLFEEPGFGFQSHPFGSRGVFFNRGVFSYSLDRRSSEAFIVGIQVNHMWFDNGNSNC
jgi:hypothetical protein